MSQLKQSRARVYLNAFTNQKMSRSWNNASTRHLFHPGGDSLRSPPASPSRQRSGRIKSSRTFPKTCHHIRLYQPHTLPKITKHPELIDALQREFVIANLYPVNHQYGSGQYCHRLRWSQHHCATKPAEKFGSYSSSSFKSRTCREESRATTYKHCVAALFSHHYPT